MLSLEKLLQKSAGLGLEKIVQRAQDMDDFAHKLRATLNPDLAAQICAINVRDEGDLVVVCTSSAWAARLRFESEQLIAQASKLGVNVSRCHIRVSSG